MELYQIIDELQNKWGDHSIKLLPDGTITAIHGRSQVRRYKVRNGSLNPIK